METTKQSRLDYQWDEHRVPSHLVSQTVQASAGWHSQETVSGTYRGEVQREGMDDLAAFDHA